MLKVARQYGEAAQMKKLSAVVEIDSFNKLLKYQQVQSISETGCMTPLLVQDLIRHGFKNGKNAQSEKISQLLEDGFSVLRFLSKKTVLLSEFPSSPCSENKMSGITIEATSRFLTRRPNKYWFEFTIKFTNPTSASLQLVSEIIEAKDENLTEITRKTAVMKLKRKALPVLESEGTYEYINQLSLPTSFGSFTGTYLFVDRATGQLLQIKTAPLLLSTRHDPDVTYEESRLYRGDQTERWNGVERHIVDATYEGHGQMGSKPNVNKTDVDRRASGGSSSNSSKQTTESMKQEDFQEEEDEMLHQKKSTLPPQICDDKPVFA